jgi:hypothetical protein
MSLSLSESRSAPSIRDGCNDQTVQPRSWCLVVACVVLGYAMTASSFAATVAHSKPKRPESLTVVDHERLMRYFMRQAQPIVLFAKSRNVKDGQLPFEIVSVTRGKAPDFETRDSARRVFVDAGIYGFPPPARLLPSQRAAIKVVTATFDTPTPHSVGDLLGRARALSVSSISSVPGIKTGIALGIRVVSLGQDDIYKPQASSPVAGFYKNGLTFAVNKGALKLKGLSGRARFERVSTWLLDTATDLAKHDLRGMIVGAAVGALECQREKALGHHPNCKNLIEWFALLGAIEESLRRATALAIP